MKNVIREKMLGLRQSIDTMDEKCVDNYYETMSDIVSLSGDVLLKADRIICLAQHPDFYGLEPLEALGKIMRLAFDIENLIMKEDEK